MLPDDAMRELVRDATLSPSSHNTQCWRFRVEPGCVSVQPDFSRRCPWSERGAAKDVVMA